MLRLPVNPHAYEGAQYLVSARGHSQWVRNMRAAGGGELRGVTADSSDVELLAAAPDHPAFRLTETR
jgi:hypothetical protein